MPFKTKAEKAAYDKQYNIDNREKRKEQINQYNNMHREEKADYDKQYNIDNAEEIKKQQKQWRIDNPAKVKKYNTMGNWKHKGMIGDLSFIYDNYYLPATNCWVCNKIFKNTRDRCCDHDHSITDGENWRQILCNKCNSMDSWKRHSEWV